MCMVDVVFRQMTLSPDFVQVKECCVFSLSSGLRLQSELDLCCRLLSDDLRLTCSGQNDQRSEIISIASGIAVPSCAVHWVYPLDLPVGFTGWIHPLDSPAGFTILIELVFELPSRSPHWSKRTTSTPKHVRSVRVCSPSEIVERRSDRRGCSSLLLVRCFSPANPDKRSSGHPDDARCTFQKEACVIVGMGDANRIQRDAAVKYLDMSSNTSSMCIKILHRRWKTNVRQSCHRQARTAR